MIDLTGQKKGRLTVIRRNGSIGGEAAWFCLCECGNTGTYRSRCLRTGMTQSCGCLKKERISQAQVEDLTGQVFGFLLVEELDSIAKNRQCKWRCKCLLCGGKTIVFASNLKRHHTISCGCLATSENETIIDIAIRSKNINYRHGYSFPDLLGPSGGYLEFDFAFFDKNNRVTALLEYQGEQHYKEMPNDKHFGELQRSYTDKYKKDYCKENKIQLFEIKYDDDILVKLDSILSQINYSHVNTVPSSEITEKV